MRLSRAQRFLLSSSLSVFLVGCGAPNYSQSEMHITAEEVETQKPIQPDKIPALVKATPIAPAFSESRDSDTYDVVVTSVPVRDLLFALARDSGINMDIDDRVNGIVTISALDQTLDAILERIGKQVDIRVERVGDAIVVKPDTNFYKYYNVDFVNVDRTYTSTAGSTGVDDIGEATISNTAANSFWENLEDSIATILNVVIIEGGSSSEVAAIDGDEVSLASAVSAESEFRIAAQLPSFNLNPETGILIVYAPERLHKEVQTFLDNTLAVAKRQVLLEATVVEVVLNNQYTQGIDWSLFNSLATDGLGIYQGVSGAPAAALNFITQVFNSATVAETFSVTTDAEANVQTTAEDAQKAAQRALAANLASFNTIRSNPLNTVTSYTPPVVTIGADGSATLTAGTMTYERINQNATTQRAGGLAPTNAAAGNFFTTTYRNGDLSAAVQLLDEFGDARVLSSPRISALNHQPAILRVVDQEVYFDIDYTETFNPDTGLPISRSFDIVENTVDIGFVMNVFPYISEDDEIILNLKPSVNRILSYRQAPSPAVFGTAGSSGAVQNLVPITRVREMESIMSLRDGEVAVMGGLLEDRTGDNNKSLPGVSKLPGIGSLFENKSESTYKTEFVVFIRAKIIRNPSINGDYSDYRRLLPSSDFIIRDTETTAFPPKQEKTR